MVLLLSISCITWLVEKQINGAYVLFRAANSVDFYIEFKFEFEFNIFIFASSSSSSSPVKIYQVFSSSENKVIDLA